MIKLIVLTPSKPGIAILAEGINISHEAYGPRTVTHVNLNYVHINGQLKFHLAKIASYPNGHGTITTEDGSTFHLNTEEHHLSTFNGRGIERFSS